MNRMTLEQTQLQTRLFDTTGEGTRLSASTDVLQNLGFHLDESKTELGLIVGSKDTELYHQFFTALEKAMFFNGI